MFFSSSIVAWTDHHILLKLGWCSEHKTSQSKVGIVVRVDPCFEHNRKTASRIENIPFVSVLCTVWNRKTMYWNIKRGNFFIESRVSCILIMRILHSILTKLVYLRCTYWHLQYQNNILFKKRGKRNHLKACYISTIRLAMYSYYRRHPIFICDCR